MAWIITFFIGASAVLQGGLNRKIMANFGLPITVILNSLIVLILTIAFWISAKYFPHLFPNGIENKNDFSEVGWWYIIPAICGFILITGIPSVIPRLGALNVFMCIVIGQMVTSLLWDYYVESISITWPRMLGALVVAGGVVITNFK